VAALYITSAYSGRFIITACIQTPSKSASNTYPYILASNPKDFNIITINPLLSLVYRNFHKNLGEYNM